MTSTSIRPTASPRSSPPAIAWRSWPIRDQGRRAWLPAAIVPVAAVVTGFSTAQWQFALAAAAVLAILLWRLWLPIAYEIHSKGVVQSVLGRTRLTSWKNIRRFEPRPAGVMLYASSDGSAWDVLRGLYLPCGERRDEVISVLSHYLRGVALSDEPSSMPRFLGR